MTQTFAADVSAWVHESKARLLAVLRESAQDLVSQMQTPVGAGGNMPVATGFLRASLSANVGAPGPIVQRPPGLTEATYNPSVANLVIIGWDGSEPLYITYGANYAAAVHYGTSKMAGRQWVTLAAQNWPSIVAANAARLRQQNSGASR